MPQSSQALRSGPARRSLVENSSRVRTTGQNGSDDRLRGAGASWPCQSPWPQGRFPAVAPDRIEAAFIDDDGVIIIAASAGDRDRALDALRIAAQEDSAQKQS
jgi:hypothetical protein